jgi:hypothetical protein
VDKIQQFRAFWNRRSKGGKWAIGIGVALLGAIIIGAIGNIGDDKSASPTTAPEVAAEPPPPPATPRPKEKDTGRMSDTEFESFRSAIADLTREGQELANEYQACSVIGQCVKTAYRGVEDSVGFAEFTAEDLLDDTAKQCRAALKTYLVVSPNFGNVMRAAYDTAYGLNFDAMPAAFNRMPPATRRWSKYSLNAMKACRPK